MEQKSDNGKRGAERMTDNEIIKALECCTSEDFTCNGCPYIAVDMSGAEYDCSYYARKDAFDLIKRQQAEIDKKNKALDFIKNELENVKNLVLQNRETTLKIQNAYERLLASSRTEAFKEFAEKLKAEYSTPDIFMPFNWISCEEMVLDEIIKEMVGADNAK